MEVQPATCMFGSLFSDTCEEKEHDINYLKSYHSFQKIHGSPFVYKSFFCPDVLVRYAKENCEYTMKTSECLMWYRASQSQFLLDK